MIRRALAAAVYGLAGWITAACVQATPERERSGEAPPPVPTGTPALNYRGMTARLVTPLSAMIVSARTNSPTGATQYQMFEAAARPILEEMEGLYSPQAISIRATISNVRASWPTRDVEALERARLSLLEVH